MKQSTEMPECLSDSMNGTNTSAFFFIITSRDIVDYVIAIFVYKNVRARLHETRSELKPVWNLKPLWNSIFHLNCKIRFGFPKTIKRVIFSNTQLYCVHYWYFWIVHFINTSSFGKLFGICLDLVDIVIKKAFCWFCHKIFGHN